MVPPGGRLMSNLSQQCPQTARSVVGRRGQYPMNCLIRFDSNNRLINHCGVCGLGGGKSILKYCSRALITDPYQLIWLWRQSQNVPVCWGVSLGISVKRCSAAAAGDRISLPLGVPLLEAEFLETNGSDNLVSTVPG